MIIRSTHERTLPTSHESTHRAILGKPELHALSCSTPAPRMHADDTMACCSCSCNDAIRSASPRWPVRGERPGEWDLVRFEDTGRNLVGELTKPGQILRAAASESQTHLRSKKRLSAETDKSQAYMFMLCCPVLLKIRFISMSRHKSFLPCRPYFKIDVHIMQSHLAFMLAT